MLEPGQFELLMSVDEARRLAADAVMPVEEAPEEGWIDEPLVDLMQVDPTFQLDVQYATASNFLSAPLYQVAGAYLRTSVAEDVQRVHSQLKTMGYGLIIHDAYRPWTVTWMMWQVTPEHLREDFLADPARGSIHNRGGAVDVSLYDLENGEPLVMPSAFDEFSERASIEFAGGTAASRRLRDLLIAQMADHGFGVYRLEWWHFNHGNARRYPLERITLAELAERDEAAASES